jgi:hypothetical protein
MSACGAFADTWKTSVSAELDRCRTIQRAEATFTDAADHYPPHPDFPGVKKADLDALETSDLAILSTAACYDLQDSDLACVDAAQSWRDLFACKAFASAYAVVIAAISKPPNR